MAIIWRPLRVCKSENSSEYKTPEKVTINRENIDVVQILSLRRMSSLCLTY